MLFTEAGVRCADHSLRKAPSATNKFPSLQQCVTKRIVTKGGLVLDPPIQTCRTNKPDALQGHWRTSPQRPSVHHYPLPFLPINSYVPLTLIIIFCQKLGTKISFSQLFLVSPSLSNKVRSVVTLFPAAPRRSTTVTTNVTALN